MQHRFPAVCCWLPHIFGVCMRCGPLLVASGLSCCIPDTTEDVDGVHAFTMVYLDLEVGGMDDSAGC